MYRANLSFEQLSRYLQNLVRADLIQEDSLRRMYVVTERGLEFLRHYEELREAEQLWATNRAELLQMLARSGAR
jgi:predicted transcriptional regulator